MGCCEAGVRTGRSSGGRGREHTGGGAGEEGWGGAGEPRRENSQILKCSGVAQ